MIQNLKVLILGNDLAFLQIGLAGIQHDIGIKVEYLFQIGHGHVQQGANLGGQGFQKPDVRHGRGQLDMAHALAPYLGGDDLHAAFFTDNAAVLHALVLAAVALVVLYRAEDLGAEQAIPLRLEGAVVDGFRLFHLAVGPFADGLRRGNGNLDGFQIADVGHVGRRAASGEKIVQAHISVPCFVKSSLESLLQSVCRDGRPELVPCLSPWAEAGRACASYESGNDLYSASSSRSRI